MKKIAIILVSMFALTGCVETTSVQEQEADLARVQSSLPAGCTLHYAGEVRVEGYNQYQSSRVFFTICGNAVTTSDTRTVQEGKYTAERNEVAVVIK